jgi:alpha-1,2-mannosyltransferase
MRHIEKLWPFADVVMCYPPVALKRFNNLKSNAETLFEKTNQVNILSLGQFRPEKNHRSQLETLNILKNSPQKKFCLIMAGGVRNEDDQRIVDDLRQYADKLKLVENVDYRFVLNTPLDELLKLMSVS